MTVAAVILAATAESALAEANGRAAVRRIAEVAWAGGAVPLIVVAPDGEGSVAAALAGSEARLVEPAPFDAGAAGQIWRGAEASRDAVGETDAVLIWPARMTWVDAETVTSLLQAHGLQPSAILRPTWQDQRGWPALLPVQHLDALLGLGSDRTPDELLDGLAATAELRLFDLGDPGVTHDVSLTWAAVPPYEGPSRPLGDPSPEWGAAGDDGEDTSPLEGSSLAPYGQASETE